MRFSSMKPILQLAEEKNIAYGAFVMTNYDMALAAIEAGSELNVPVIFIIGEDCAALMGGFKGTVETVERAAANSTIPIAIHLDHCRTFEGCVEAIKAGFTSVMIDGSSLPFEENIALTRKVVEYAHPLGISVEAELGKLIGEEGNLIVKGPEGAQTDPLEAKEFVERTGVDFLAVSIGTQHGVYKAAPHLNIERLAKIKELVNIPIVLHGGSGTPVDQVQDAIEHGIRKINVATDVFRTMVDSYALFSAEPDFKYNTVVFTRVKDAMKEFIMSKMKDFSLYK